MEAGDSFTGWFTCKVSFFSISCVNISNHTISKKVVLMLKYFLGFRENPSLVRTRAVQNPVLFLCLTDFSQQTAGSHAQYLESTSPTQNVGLHVGLCSADSVVFQIRNVCRFVTSESPLSL